MGIFFTYNNIDYKQGEPVVNVDSRGLKYGDGLFETMLLDKGKIQLADLHFDRLYMGLRLLHFEVPTHFTKEKLTEKILHLCKKNDHHSLARVRITIFRGNGGLFDVGNHYPNFIIETNDIEYAIELNLNGLMLDVYPDAKKAIDNFSNIKSNNFQPYFMAALHAQKLKVNDCLVLNHLERICDTTIANIFIIKDDIIYTPPLSEGCIAGVMRRFILENLSGDFKITEKPLNIDAIKSADEVFLSNSIKRIRWVKEFRQSHYSNIIIKKIDAFIAKSIY